jgi:predicted MFS family arabinose efflux permease
MFCLGLGPGVMAIYGFFVEPLSQEFGVGAALLNAGPIALLLIPGFFGPAIGKMADRLPVRMLLLVGVTVSMLSLLAISRAPTLPLVALGFLCFALGMNFYGPVVINGMLVKLYAGREARALAIAAIGISFAAALLPPLLGSLLVHLDWRGALQWLSLGMLALLWVFILVGTPHGVVSVSSSEQRSADKSFYRDPAFWLIGLCVALSANVSIVLTVCYPVHFASQGFSPAQAGWFLAASGAGGLLGKTCLAWLGDAIRSQAKWVAVAVLLVQCIGVNLLHGAEGVPQVVMALGLIGFGAGAILPVHPFLNSRYFDAAVSSHVNGAQMPLFLPFALVGAPLAGYVFDRTGSYEPVLVALAVVLVAAVMLAARLPAAVVVSERPGERPGQ